MRFQRGDTLGLQAPGVVQFEIVFVNMNFMAHWFRPPIPEHFYLDIQTQAEAFHAVAGSNFNCGISTLWLAIRESSFKSGRAAAAPPYPKSGQQTLRNFPNRWCERTCRRNHDQTNLLHHGVRANRWSFHGWGCRERCPSRSGLAGALYVRGMLE